MIKSYYLHIKDRELYLTAATYLSSRAFPSTILSRTPSLQSSLLAKPILLPGIDSLNHGRCQPVSWVVSYSDKTETTLKTPNISLVLHAAACQGQELLNNYGAKPNSELILGYGFSLPRNPDDTIVLKIGGIDGNKWEVGRFAKGVDGIWNEIVRSIQEDPNSSPDYEDHLNAAGALMEMAGGLLDRLPANKDRSQYTDMRPEVLSMLHDYVEGQSYQIKGSDAETLSRSARYFKVSDRLCPQERAPCSRGSPRGRR